MNDIYAKLCKLFNLRNLDIRNADIQNINDIYGHTCGDAVLKNFASILKRGHNCQIWRGRIYCPC